MHFIFKLQTELHFTSIILIVFKKKITQKQNSTGNRRNLMQDWCFCMQFDVMHSNHLEIKKFRNIKIQNLNACNDCTTRSYFPAEPYLISSRLLCCLWMVSLVLSRFSCNNPTCLCCLSYSWNQTHTMITQEQ